MVKKFPPTLEDLRKRRENVPASEVAFYKLLDSLSDDWYAWHSISWDNVEDSISGETDFLLFNPNYGFIVVEVKGGIISVEDCVFYSTNTMTGEKNKLNRDPFDQATNSMYQILRYYVKVAKKEPNPELYLKGEGSHMSFPLNFNHMVFFPNTKFKDEIDNIQYEKYRVFDESDLVEQSKESGSEINGKSHLEVFLIKLLDKYSHFRVHKPDVENFFVKFLGTNVRNYVSLQKYYQSREEELSRINEVQDFLLNTLSEKKECFFKGSAGSGKTFIAIKKAIMNYKKGIKTLILCFNSELRESIKDYLAQMLDTPYERLKGEIDVYSIHLFLQELLQRSFDTYLENYLRGKLKKFEYPPIAQKVKENKDKIPLKFKYDAILIDEAQDINESFWGIFPVFFNNPDKGIFYVFFDEAQAIFSEDFSPSKFGMDEKKDLLVLNQNLRNTVQIATWLESETHLGHYEKFSGIHGFDITNNRVSTAKQALEKAAQMIKNRFYQKAIEPNQVIMLSYNKLKTLIGQQPSPSNFDFYEPQSESDVVIVEPSNFSELEKIKYSDKIRDKKLIVFKTISSFKGLERDIIFLIIPNIFTFKKSKPDMHDNFIKQVYVGASRAKFKLHVIEFDKI